MNSLTRRSFLKTSTVAALGFPAIVRAQTSANEEIRVGVVGFNGRGESHISGFGKQKNVRVAALCDVDKSVLDRGVKKLAADTNKVTGYNDLRKLYEDKTIDVISIATPNHWHALAAIWAIQAGKDVYLEKPVSHNVWEGRQIVKAARKHARIVQTGTQSRSSHGIRDAVAWVKEGNLGKILVARGQCYKPRGPIGKTAGPQPIPGSVDYDLWCGPAPLTPPRRNSSKYGAIHYDWHWFWDYGCGDLGNQGIHQMDIARWFLGEMELSPAVLSLGGRLGYEDDAETPNTQIVYHGYAKAPLVFEVRGLPEKTDSKNMDRYPAKNGGSVCVNIECEGGRVFVPDYNKAVAYDKDGAEVKTFTGGEDHFENFIKAVRSRKVADLNADILEGHLSSALCHTGNISYRLGAKKSPDEIKAALKTKVVAEAYDRMAAHLEANGVDLKATPATLGVPLEMDGKAERFPGNEAANKMLTRDYRKPYVVPEIV